MLIFWDIDGTLMTCGADGTRALDKTFLELYGVPGAFVRAGIGGAMDSAIVGRAMDGAGLGGADMDAFKAAYAENLEAILRADTAKRVLPGVVALLKRAREREDGAGLLLTSNFRVGAEAKLRSVGLWEYFSDAGALGGFGDFQGEKWDAARAALREAERLAGRGFRPDETVIVGDSAYDARCARLLGWRNVAVATGWTSKAALAAERPDFLFDDLSDTRRAAAALGLPDGPL
ncbi:MAG: haloacid dehalogenase-like hydrolase [Clostridiales Family XIII bacterium]|jgi:phosphoglycolate phosphatase-like HAD superfamily hydrolase|nr:haloacid dehalogenase-like hydrolase [Clostridiales Family XIII bacterium]